MVFAGAVHLVTSKDDLRSIFQFSPLFAMATAASNPLSHLNRTARRAEHDESQHEPLGLRQLGNSQDMASETNGKRSDD